MWSHRGVVRWSNSYIHVSNGACHTNKCSLQRMVRLSYRNKIRVIVGTWLKKNDAHKFVGARVMQLVSSLSHMLKVDAHIALKEQLGSLNSITAVLNGNYFESNHVTFIWCDIPQEEACVKFCLEK